MSETNINLTTAEWNVMECLWEASPKTSREIVEQLKHSTGWSKSTTMTMLNRMTEKGLIACDADSQKVRLYSPCVNRDLAVKKETENFLKRVYKGSVSLMMSAMTKEQELSDEEINELYEILKRSKKTP
ncbi:MAG: BlaI/MecI/CopY family transcriptional regulator [Lachnospiraceae bacterium]